MKKTAVAFIAAILVMVAVGLWLGRDLQRAPAPAPAAARVAQPAQAPAKASPSPMPAPAQAPQPEASRPAGSLTQAPSGGEMSGTLGSTPAASSSPPHSQVQPPSASRNSVGAPPPSLVRGGPANAPPPPPDDEATRQAAALDVDKIYLMLRDYRTLVGSNPVGTNAEIMKAVMGGNPKGAQLGPPDGQRLNNNGELVDRWGTPYFFHQMSARDMEIRSAGPDKMLWTSDDIVQK